MKKRRSKQQWLELIQKQKQNGLSVAEFCRREYLQDKYFYKRKSEFEKESCAESSSPFVQLEPKPKENAPHFMIRSRD